MKKPNFSVTPTGIPVLSNQEIDRYAEALIGEYYPLLLQTPAPVDIQQFVRNILGCRLASLPLCSDGSISGQTFFRESLLDYCDERGMHHLRVPAGTIILNRDLLAEPGEARFCLAHEVGHFLLHGDFFRAKPASLSPQEEKCLEAQADRFACAFLIPASTITAYWNSIQVYCDSVYEGKAELANKYAAACFAMHYRVSRACAARRLLQLDLVRREVKKSEESRAVG